MFGINNNNRIPLPEPQPLQINVVIPEQWDMEMEIKVISKSRQKETGFNPFLPPVRNISSHGRPPALAPPAPPAPPAPIVAPSGQPPHVDAPSHDNPPASSDQEKEILEMMRNMDLGQEKQEKKKMYTNL